MDIFDFKKWWPQSYKKTTNSDETSARNIPKDEKKPFKISTFKQFLYNQATPGKVIAKGFINGLTMSTFSLRKCAVLPELPTEKAYPMGKVPINKKKIEDLMKLRNYLTGFEEFYNPILQWPTTDGDTDRDYVFEA